MVKRKKLKLSLISLLVALILAFAAAALTIKYGGMKVYAADRYVELDGNSVFYTTINGAEICESDEREEGEGEDKRNNRYTQFKIGKDETVAYRQNLAYRWISNQKDEEGNFTNVPDKDKTFSMEFYFPEINFEKFYVRFQSQQYTLNKDKISENYLVFTADGESVKIGVSSTAEKEDDKITDITDVTEIGTLAKGVKATVSFGEYSEGEYTICLDGEPKSGKFVNVYRDCATYVASGDTAVTPLTFGAIFKEDADLNTEAKFVLTDINGQSFQMHLQGEVYKVKDTAAPVICFSKTPSYLEYGKTIGFQYKVIDVLASSPRSTAYYYILTGEQFKDADYDYDRTDYEEKSDSSTEEGEGEATEEVKNPFIKVSSSSGVRLNTDADTFIPSKYLDSDVVGLVKIYYELSDVSSTSTAQTDKVFVNWYVEEETPEALVNIYDIKKESGKTSNFLKLIKKKVGGVTYATYGNENAENLEAYKQCVRNFQQDYQDKINEARANLKYDEDSGLTNGKLYAGGDKFYLPAIADLFSDEYSTGTDYSYSIYYRGNSSGSHASLDFNKLAIDLNDADVTYRFTIFISDRFGNPMRYPDENGEWQDITTSDVWNEDFAELLPYFEFDVSYKEATAEDAKNISLSYVNSSYSGVSFKITGVSSTYSTKYNLYIFDRDAYLAEVNETLDYDTFTANTQALLNNTYKEGVNTRKFFTTVKPKNELLETDENYELFNKINWNATSITFTPQSVEDFYVVELKLTDDRSQKYNNYYATVASSVQANPLKGETGNWASENKTPITLFVVSGVCLLALVFLLLVKPKDKGDIDVLYTEVEEKSKKGKNKNK